MAKLWPKLLQTRNDDPVDPFTLDASTYMTHHTNMTSWSRRELVCERWQARDNYDDKLLRCHHARLLVSRLCPVEAD